MELLKSFLLNGDIISRTLTLEGICRVIYNKKLGNNSDDIVHDLVVLLLLIWNDAKILKQGGCEAIQILSTFFRQYVLSADHIFSFEKALETIIYLLISVMES